MWRSGGWRHTELTTDQLRLSLRGGGRQELLDRAGGLTSQAFVKGAAFTRKDLKEREQKQLDELGEKLQADLAAQALGAAAASAWYRRARPRG